MYAPLEENIARYKKDGRLAVAANLLFDLVSVGWIAFAGLYALETLLPTFVTARLSLVKLAVVLLLLTSALAWLGKMLEVKGVAENEKRTHLFLIVFVVAGIGIVALAHYRFPWWSIPVSIGGYMLAGWLFLKSAREER